MNLLCFKIWDSLVGSQAPKPGKGFELVFHIRNQKGRTYMLVMFLISEM